MGRNVLHALALSALAACALRVTGEPRPDAGPDAPAECVRGEDCDDGVACTADQCVGGRCARVALDARCEDGDRCDPRRGCFDPRCADGLRACEVRGGALRCVRLTSDREHCGACGRACGLGEVCVGGACVRPPGGVGARCGEGLPCAEGLRCDDARNGMCTQDCEDYGTDDASEAFACGGAGRRCVRGEAGPTCALACEPLSRPGSAGGCAVGEVCTGAWWLDPQYRPDAPGCQRWCSTDSDCAGDPRGARCNPRLGRCAGVGEDRSLRPDGAPCDPRATTRVPGDPVPRSAECRGFCAPAGGDPARGVCASFVDRARFARCPDDGFVVAQRGPFGADNLALCLWRYCAGDCECEAPLRCLLPEAGGRPLEGERRICLWPTASQPAGLACR